MTEGNPDNKDAPAKEDILTQIREETAQQIKALKESFESTVKEKDDQIAKLTEDNESLKRALVRSAVTEPPKEEVQKSEEELYKEKITQLAKNSINYTRNYS